MRNEHDAHLALCARSAERQRWAQVLAKPAAKHTQRAAIKRSALEGAQVFIISALLALPFAMYFYNWS